MIMSMKIRQQQIMTDYKTKKYDSTAGLSQVYKKEDPSRKLAGRTHRIGLYQVYNLSTFIY